MTDLHYKRPLFPTSSDLQPQKPTANLPVNKKEGAYADARDYLRTHIDLLSEDFMSTLHEQVNEYRNSKRMTGRIFSIEFGEREEGYPRCFGRDGVYVHFHGEKHKHISDEDKRFMFGSLLLFSKDNFSTVTFGIVKKSSPHELRKGKMLVRLVSGVSTLGNLVGGVMLGDATYLMMESQAFYFPYLHVTTVLRGMFTRFTVPFENEIVYAKTGETPWYASLSSLHDVIKKGTKDLNASQLTALQSVFKHRVALVQGPPGTGKTYLGCKIVEILVMLKQIRGWMAPILVITTTQHAVDEFLKRCRNFTDDVIHANSGMNSAGKDCGDLQKKYNSARSPGSQLDVLRHADVIAMTTTRAAYCYDRFLQPLRIEIVVVEEAAEALEGYIVAGIPRRAKHLILLGDHKQLCPSTANHQLSLENNLSLSLMERLVNNGFECPMLSEQRRMRPEISSLISHIYPGLRNHSETEGRPHINGMRKDVFFLTHSEGESQDDLNPSYGNPYEAGMVVELCLYLLARGYDPEDITILTTYRKQLKLIINEAKGTPASDVRAAIVDNFQGEENKIILLSLVRSNDKGSVGFMKKENRACVALSRARDGLYVFANLSCLVASGAPVWSKVLAALSEQDLFGKKLPLICPHGRRYDAATVEDLQEATIGCVICQFHSAWRQAMDELKEAEETLQLRKEKLQNVKEKGKEENEDEETYNNRVTTAKRKMENAETILILAESEEEKFKDQLDRVMTLWSEKKITIMDTLDTVQELLLVSQLEDLFVV